MSLVQGDITLESADAIVNAANATLMGGGGVDGAIHSAGGRAILYECMRIVAKHGPLSTGKAVITTGGDLKAKHVIHTVGPVWQGGMRGEAILLASSYTESLKLATANGLVSIAFPSISTGAYNFPPDRAAPIALGSMAKYLKENTTTVKDVRFVLHDSETYKAYAQALAAISRMA